MRHHIVSFQLIVLALVLHVTRGASIGSTTTLVCPRNGTSSREMRLDTYDPVQRFTEVSGLVFSKTQLSPFSGSPIFYVITDGKNNNTVGGGRVGVYDSGTGQRLLTYVFSKRNTEENWDYESMTLGSCGPSFRKEEQCIYVGDTGDNVALGTNGRRSKRGDQWPYRILKFREPNLLSVIGSDSFTIPNSDVWILPFNYHHSTSPSAFADSEGMLLDHTGWGDGGAIGDLYLITKWGGSRSRLKNRVFKIAASQWEHPPEQIKGGVTFLRMVSPSTVGRYENEASAFLLYQWRGADMTSDGTVISLTTVEETHLFLRCPGESVADALTGSSKACYRFAHAAVGQTETSAWTSDGRRYLQIPEGRRARMGWSDVIYNHPLSLTRECPSFAITTEPTTSPTTMHPTSGHPSSDLVPTESPQSSTSAPSIRHAEATPAPTPSPVALPTAGMVAVELVDEYDPSSLSSGTAGLGSGISFLLLTVALLPASIFFFAFF